MKLNGEGPEAVMVEVHIPNDDGRSARRPHNDNAVIHD
jgi:hypothetical protein